MPEPQLFLFVSFSVHICHGSLKWLTAVARGPRLQSFVVSIIVKYQMHICDRYLLSVRMQVVWNSTHFHVLQHLLYRACVLYMYGSVI